MTDPASLTKRLDRIEEAVVQLEELGNRSAEDFARDPVGRAAVERFLEISIQSMIDVGNRLIAEHRWKGVGSYSEVFARLAEHGVLSEQLAARLVQAAGLRNRLAHEYMDIDFDLLLDGLPVALADMKAFVVAIYKDLDATARG